MQLSCVVMELTSSSVARSLFPWAAFAGDFPDNHPSNDEQEYPDGSWKSSTLNPKNRIDSLDPLQDPKWRIDGCTAMGTQFYARPLFFHPIHPVRVDLFVPQSKDIPSRFCELLNVHTAIHLRDFRVASLGISRYVVRVLEYWTSQLLGFERIYNELPFGSRIILENIATDIRDVRVQVVKTHFLERQLLSSDSLQRTWGFSSPWPELVDIAEVHLMRQLHDSVSLVRLRDQVYILKALTSYPKYLYHELKVLLTLPPHPNIISRPHYLITKQCNFGGKVAVIGFTLQYHGKGTLRDQLSLRRQNNTLRLNDQLKWAIQLAQTLRCIRDVRSFYCDLRLDNVVLDDSDGIVLIDFEARGVAFSASAPEINYLEYIYSIATDTDESLYPAGLRDVYQQLYGRMIQGHCISKPRESYKNPRHGYSVPWLCLNGKEREAAEVYMLGRTLWCIFEGVGVPEKTAMVQHLREDELEFPQWKRAPEKIRNIVQRCTRFGTEVYKSLPVMRSGKLLVVRGDGKGMGANEAQEVAKRYWQTELEFAKAFVEGRLSSERASDQIPHGRPGLDDVMQELQGIRECLEDGN